MQIHVDLARVEGLAEICCEGKTARSVGIGLGHIELDARSLRPSDVCRGIGTLQQRVGGRRVVRVEGDTNARTQDERHCLGGERNIEGRVQRLCHLERGSGIGHSGDEHRELVAGEAGEDRLAGDAVGQPLANRHQQSFGEGRSEGVVDLFERVEIDEDQRDAMALGAGALDGVGEVVSESPPVG